MKRPLKLFTFALTALLSSAVYCQRNTDVAYRKVFELGRQAVQVAAKVGVAQTAFDNAKTKKAYQKKALHECVQGSIYALERLELSDMLKDQGLGWFERKYVEAKVNEAIQKLYEMPAPSINRRQLTQMQKNALHESYLFGRTAIKQSISVGLSLGVIAHEQMRKDFGKRFTTEFTAGVETTLRDLDVKAIAQTQGVSLADNQVENVKRDMQEQVELMQNTIQSGALKDFFALQQ